MMNNIGTLYTYELKKIASRKLVWIVGMIYDCSVYVFKCK